MLNPIDVLNTHKDEPMSSIGLGASVFAEIADGKFSGLLTTVPAPQTVDVGFMPFGIFLHGVANDWDTPLDNALAQVIWQDEACADTEFEIVYVEDVEAQDAEIADTLDLLNRLYPV
jgi:hypothetical protein